MFNFYYFICTPPSLLSHTFVRRVQKINLCTSFHSCGMFHFENTAKNTPKKECFLAEKQSLLLVFSSITISSIRRYVYVHVCWFSRERKSFYKKNDLQKFLLISGSHICGPKWYTNMASPYKALQMCVGRFGK